jgi:hypothetical protein
MKINPNLNLILRDLYLYDIEACHYNIMKQLGLDISELNENDKTERNIKIGQMMRKNPRLTSVLRNTTSSIIDEYIRRNKIQDDEIVIRQYDGMILTRGLNETHVGNIPLNRRKFYRIFIASIDRSKYISLDYTGKVSIKGVPYRYSHIDSIYEKICKLNFGKKGAIFRGLQIIKDNFLNSNDSKLFGVPLKNGKFNVFLKRYGEMHVSEQTLKIMDTDDIDKQRYFDFYIIPFTKSIVYEYVR